ncbi:GNAT family N-acetyltransferase [Oricola thermophila]|uniref:GNAT family N-acetyltransferase n=1 Tax=Oricola thermophila TaxID=2742145 RepID=A0A6N1V9K5_9HYPH|nr:GNAT family N-acetyltransferase [Oricola thermophila]QKV17691.1 GNAT family N-acetyltransferase [Oricola thermophila]
MNTMQTPTGTEQQVALRRRLDSSAGWLITTPGACDGGQYFAADDPDLLGWDTVLRRLHEDGIFGFRLVDVERQAAIEDQLAGNGCRIEWMDVFRAGANTIREALRGLDLSLPDGYRLIDAETLTYPDTIREVQAFMAANGLAPVSTALLSGRRGPCVPVAVTGPDGAIVATSFCHFPHNVHSPHDDTAWCGLSAVDPHHRGRGLGLAANAMAMRGMIEEKGARAIYQLAAHGDEAARNMAERCGLALDLSLLAGVAMPARNAPGN